MVPLLQHPLHVLLLLSQIQFQVNAQVLLLSYEFVGTDALSGIKKKGGCLNFNKTETKCDTCREG